jgi:hypothetical protein
MPSATGSGRRAVAWSSFIFALLQSVCTFFAAVDGLRLIIGIGSLAIAAEFGAVLDKLHTNWIRVPMLVLALSGAILNLIVLAQVRYLRNRPASQWRRQALSPGKIRMERLQLVLSIATLILIAIEEYFHFGLQHHI